MYDVLCKEKPGKHLFSSRNILFTSKQRCAIANQSFFLSRTLCVLQTYVAFKYLSSLESLTLLKLRFLKPFRPEKEVVEIIKKRLLPGWPPVFFKSNVEVLESAIFVKNNFFCLLCVIMFYAITN